MVPVRLFPFNANIAVSMFQLPSEAGMLPDRWLLETMNLPTKSKSRPTFNGMVPQTFLECKLIKFTVEQSCRLHWYSGLSWQSDSPHSDTTPLGQCAITSTTVMTTGNHPIFHKGSCAIAASPRPPTPPPTALSPPPPSLLRATTQWGSSEGVVGPAGQLWTARLLCSLPPGADYSEMETEMETKL